MKNKIRYKVLKIINFLWSINFLHKIARVLNQITFGGFNQFASYFLKKLNKQIILKFGEYNINKTIYVIRLPDHGLYSIVHLAIHHLIYAKENSYIPVIDMKNYHSKFHKNFGKENIWEIFFEQVSNITLDEVYNSKNVIISEPGYRNSNFDFEYKISLEKSKVNYINQYFKNYIHYSSKAIKFIEDKIEKSDIEFESTLGVYSRGTDYHFAKGHARQPNLDELVISIEYFLRKYKIKYIFLVTEEDEKVEYFKRRFGSLIHYNDRNRIKNYDRHFSILDWSNESAEKFIESNYNYLYEIEILSKCEYFLCGTNNGSNAAIEKNNLKYKEVRVI